MQKHAEIYKSKVPVCHDKYTQVKDYVLMARSHTEDMVLSHIFCSQMALDW